MKTFRRTGGVFMGAGVVRASAETLVLAGVFSLGLLTVVQTLPRQDLSLQVPVIGPLCAILCAARLRPGDGSRLDNLLREGAVAFALMLLVTFLQVLPLTPAASSYYSPVIGPDSIVGFVFCFNVGAFAFFRALAYLWGRWGSMRRVRLRWEMTHMYLMGAATVFLASVVLSFLYVAVTQTGTLVKVTPGSGIVGFPAGLIDRLVVALPVLGVAIFLTVVALTVLLPPVALVSYLTAKRTTYRLETLAEAAGRLSRGDLEGRVVVEGEDEISHLQKDFNVMAGDLESTMDALRAERNNVERLLKAQRELVASVSHELRTPVATMRGYLESALERGDREPQTPPELRHDLGVMTREVVRLGRLVDDLFTLSRTESGSLSLEILPTDTSPLLYRCAEAVAGGAWRAGRVEVFCDADADLPQVFADEGRLEQVVRNLLDNAVRHTPPGGLVALTASVRPDSVVVEFRDTGEGIIPEDLERVFERFYRSGNTGSCDRAGAGLGLALVRELTEAMGGEVSAESEPGSGSRFALILCRA